MRKYISREEVIKRLKKHQCPDCENLGPMDPETGSRECSENVCICQIQDEFIDTLIADFEKEFPE